MKDDMHHPTSFTPLNQKPHPLSLAIAASLGCRPTTLALALGLTATLTAITPATAATFYVTNTNDSGAGSLRQAVLEANAAAGVDEVLIDSRVTGTIRLSSGAITVTDSVTIRGPGPDRLTIDGENRAEHGFNIDPYYEYDGLNCRWGTPTDWQNPPRASLSGMTISRMTKGAVVVNTSYMCTYQPAITLTDCTIRENGAGVTSSGGYSSDVIENTTIEDNADVGVAKFAGHLTVVNSRISRNNIGIQNSGSGWYLGGGVTLEVKDSIISGNTDAGIHGQWADISGSTIEKNGDGIRQLGSWVASSVLYVTDSRIVDNTRPGISVWDMDYRGVDITILESSISGNQGSGIWLNVPSVSCEIRDSTISGNVASQGPGFDTPWLDLPSDHGGGLFINWSSAFPRPYGISQLLIENSTISGNEAARGGGIYIKGPDDGILTAPTVLNNSTVADNVATQEGGGIVVTDFEMEISNSIVANNHATEEAPDLQGIFTAHYSLIQDLAGADVYEVTFRSNLFGKDPWLGPLQDNGGPTLTHALLAGSPALDRGDPAFARSPDTDQRGAGFARVAGGRLDLGAVEQQLLPRLVALGDPNRNGIPDIAVLYQAYGGAITLSIRDAQTNAWGQPVTLNSTYAPLDLVLVPDLDANGAPELAVLGRATGARVQVEMRDTLTGLPLNPVAFPSTLTPLRLALVADLNGNGAPELAVLGLSTRTGAVTAVLKRERTGVELKPVSFNSAFQPIDFAVVADLNGNRAPELAVLGVNAAGQPWIELRDTKSGALVNTLVYANLTRPQAMKVVPDTNRNGAPELAVLGRRGTAVVVTTLDARTRARVGTGIYTAISLPQQLTVVPDLNTNGVAELAVWGRDAAGAAKAELRDARTGWLVRQVGFDPVSPRDLVVLPDMNGNRTAELALLGVSPGRGNQVLIKDANTLATVGTLGF